MQLISSLPRLLLLIVTMGSPSWAQTTGGSKQVPVELLHVGDDGLSQRLAVTMEGAFARAPEFVTSQGRKPGTMIVLIPTNVTWEKVGGRTKVLYRVEFSWTDRQDSAMREGSCWEDELPKCAAQIIVGARNMIRRTR